MSRKIKYFLVVLAVFAAGFIFSLFASSRALAEQVDKDRKPTLVEILNLPLAITGAVSVDNLPVDEASNSLRTTSPAPVLRYGSTSISYPDGPTDKGFIPEGVVMTDAWVQAWPSGDTAECEIWFFDINVENRELTPLMSLWLSEADPVIELHFESGMPSTPDREIGFYMLSDCYAEVFWTGYEY